MNPYFLAKQMEAVMQSTNQMVLAMVIDLEWLELARKPDKDVSSRSSQKKRRG
jgi:hypothetical protein